MLSRSPCQVFCVSNIFLEHSVLHDAHVTHVHYWVATRKTWRYSTKPFSIVTFCTPRYIIHVLVINRNVRHSIYKWVCSILFQFCKEIRAKVCTMVSVVLKFVWINVPKVAVMKEAVSIAYTGQRMEALLYSYSGPSHCLWQCIVYHWLNHWFAMIFRRQLNRKWLIMCLRNAKRLPQCVKSWNTRTNHLKDINVCRFDRV